MSGDPRTDPDVRWRVEQALNDVLRAAQDVTRRNCASDGGLEIPDPIMYGDVTGLIAFGDARILKRLQEAIDVARERISEVRADIDSHQRARHGDHWRPPHAAA